MPRTRNEALAAQAGALASQGMPLAEIARRLSVSRRTLQRWRITPPPRPARLVPDEQASGRTLRRRRVPEPGRLTLAAAGRMLGVSRERARQLATAGKLKPHPGGGVTRESAEAEIAARSGE